MLSFIRRSGIVGHRKHRPPCELVQSLRNGLEELASGSEGRSKDQVAEEVTKALGELHTYLNAKLGDQKAFDSFVSNSGKSVPSISSSADPQTCLAILHNGLLEKMTRHISLIDFEARKDVVGIFTLMLRFEETASFLVDNRVMHTLIDGYNHQQVALHCGIMIRECAKDAVLCKHMLDTDEIYSFFKYVQLANFDVASDAFASLKELLVTHKEIACDFVVANFDEFFAHYNELLTGENYVTVRQSLKLLSEMMLDRKFRTVMLRYVNSDEFLKMHMNFLRSTSRAIAFEAFHIFKIFAANPQKTEKVHRILFQNKDRLIKFLNSFLCDRTADEQLMCDKATVIQRLKDLEPLH